VNVRCAPGIYRPAARGASCNKCPGELAASRSVLPARFPAPDPRRQPGPRPGRVSARSRPGRRAPDELL